MYAKLVLTDFPEKENHMRIHTNLIGYTQQVRNALQTEREAGRVANHVSFKTLEQHRSRTHQFAFEVQLEADKRDNGRRAGNSGSYGAMRPESDGYAATYDEWGWLLAALYKLDPEMLVGSVKSPYYRNQGDFDEKTGLTYNPEDLIATIEDMGYDPFPIVTGQAAKTKRGYLIGRRGANRASDVGYRPYWPHKEMPRTVAEVREYAKLTAVPA